jgi:hypothetical protein
MGTVLAMKIGTLFATLGLCATLVGCGPMAENAPSRTIAGEVRSVLRPAAQPDDAQPAAIDDQAAATPNDPPAAPVSSGAMTEGMLVSLPSRGVGALLAAAGHNGDKVTWLSPDGIGVITRNGILIGTRGLGHDLMGADVADFELITSGAPNERLIERLDGTDQIQSLVFQCVLTGQAAEEIEIATQKVATTRFDEACRNDSFIFTNKYWVNAEGRLVRSLQLVSPGVGYMVLQPV